MVFLLLVECCYWKIPNKALVISNVVEKRPSCRVIVLVMAWRHTSIDCCWTFHLRPDTARFCNLKQHLWIAAHVSRDCFWMSHALWLVPIYFIALDSRVSRDCFWTRHTLGLVSICYNISISYLGLNSRSTYCSPLLWRFTIQHWRSMLRVFTLNAFLKDLLFLLLDKSAQVFHVPYLVLYICVGCFQSVPNFAAVFIVGI